MFEEISNKNSLGGFRESLAYLLKAGLARSIFYAASVPFAALWIVRDSLATAFILQAYLVSAYVFLDRPFLGEKQIQSVRQWWFWKAMLLGGIAIHPFVL